MNLDSLDINKVFPTDKHIRTIKSKKTEQLLSLLPFDQKDTYGVQVNDKCFYTFNKTDYLLKKCVTTSDTINPQYFQPVRILDEKTEMKEFGAKSTDPTIYPYTAFRSKLTRDCLSMDNDGLYMAKCQPDNIYQQWELSPNENLCPKE